MPYLFVVWCILAVAVLSMAGYRKLVANHEDDLVHLGDGDARLISNQRNVGERLSSIDKWGKILTIVTVVFGVVLGSIYLYQGWVESAQKIRL